MSLSSFPEAYRVLVIGASGAIGAAFVAALQADPRCAQVIGLHRHSTPCIDFDIEDSIRDAANALSGQAPFHLIINAAGVLHTPQCMPEKNLSSLNYAQLLQTMRVNAVGPALVVSHFSKLLAAERAVFAVLSARVGSIEDNRLGGWYSYRASKAALNMLLKTAAIELKRSQRHTVLVALHPGTVNSTLSQPFGGNEKGRPPATAVAQMLAVMDGLQPTNTGQFLAYDGAIIPW